MNIIERITKSDKNYSNTTSNLQKISLDKLRTNPIPSSKNEIWKQTNKSKFSRFLNFKFSSGLVFWHDQHFVLFAFDSYICAGTVKPQDP